MLFLAYRTLVTEQVTGVDLEQYDSAVRGLDTRKIGRADLAVRIGGIIDASIRRFRNHMGRDPASIEELLQKPANLTPPERWDGPYINTPEILIDPWGNAYQYRLAKDDETVRYNLWSNGPDGVGGPGSDGTRGPGSAPGTYRPRHQVPSRCKAY